MGGNFGPARLSARFVRTMWQRVGVIAGLAAACTPSGGTGAADEIRDAEVPAAADPVDPPSSGPDADCEALEIAAAGPWRTDHPLLAPLRAAWHPRAEYGHPIAVRDAVPPWAARGHSFVQVQLEGVPHAVQSCWVPTDADEPPGRRECGVLWQMLSTSPVEAWPVTARAWARLVATDDGAAAVFTDPAELAKCSDAPTPVSDWTPGLRAGVPAPALTFVERFDNPRSTTWLRVDVDHVGDSLQIGRREIATVVRSTPNAPVPTPHWDPAWPLADDPIRAQIGLRAPRTHPLWATPVSDACPAVMFSALTPELGGGDTYDRVNARLPRNGHGMLHQSPYETMILHDHLELPGVRLVAAIDNPPGCMMGWSHTHCLVADDAVWCPDGTATDLQAIVDRFALTPWSLSDAQWFELVAIMTGTSTFVLEPTLLSECTQVEGAHAAPPRVTRGWDHVTVEFTAIDRSGQGDVVAVEIAAGRVTMTKTRSWAAPDPDDVWGTLE